MLMLMVDMLQLLDYDARDDYDHSVDFGLDEGVDVDVHVPVGVDVDVKVDVGVDVDMEVNVGIDIDNYVDGVNAVVDFLCGLALSSVLGVMLVQLYRKMWSLLVRLWLL